MGIITINGLEVPVSIDGGSKNIIEVGGGKSRSVNATMIGTRTAKKNQYSFITNYYTPEDAEALESLLLGEGHIWFFDSSLYSSAGLPAALTRATTAYKVDGSSVSSGAARYENGKFSATNTSDKGFQIEEGTTNLLTANQSSFETNTAGATLVGSTIAQDAIEHWSGTKSLSCHTDNAATAEGFYTDNTTTTESLDYTASVWLKGDVGATVQLRLNERTDADANVGSATSSVITLSATWTRYSVTKTFGATGKRARIYVETDVQQHITWYTDGLQLEQKGYYTGWQLAGAARNAEVVTIPTSGVLNQSGQRWSLHFLFKPTSTQIVTGKTGYLWECYIDASNIYRLLVLATGKVMAQIKSGGSTYSTSSTSMPAMAVGTWYYICLTANGEHLNLYSNGAIIAANVDYVEPVGTLPTNFYLGSDRAGANHANGLFDQFQIVPYVMSADQIAALYALTIAPGGQPKINVTGDHIRRLTGNPVSCFGEVASFDYVQLATTKRKVGFTLYD